MIETSVASPPSRDAVLRMRWPLAENTSDTTRPVDPGSLAGGTTEVDSSGPVQPVRFQKRVVRPGRSLRSINVENDRQTFSGAQRRSPPGVGARGVGAGAARAGVVTNTVPPRGCRGWAARLREDEHRVSASSSQPGSICAGARGDRQRSPAAAGRCRPPLLSTFSRRLIRCARCAASRRH